MIKRPVVFSLVREQSLFMTAIMSLMTFLAVLTLGIALAIGTAVVRWNGQWDLFATVQIMKTDNGAEIKKIISDNADKIAVANEISRDKMSELMRPWISGGGVLENYLPQMYELKFKNKSDMAAVGQMMQSHARFLTHADALKNSTSAGWKMILISAMVLIMTLGAIGACISYIARNTAMLHRRELEILNQVGASDGFIARQMQIIIAKICVVSGLIGFIAAAPMLMVILSAAHRARVGLIAMLSIGGTSWALLLLMPIIILIFAIWITRRTTLNILKNS